MGWLLNGKLTNFCYSFMKKSTISIIRESPVPVWSDTYLKEVTSAPSIADAIQRSLSQNHRSTESITTNASLRRKKETVPPRSPLLSSADKGKSRTDVVPEEPPRNDADPVPVTVAAPVPVSPSPPPRNLPSVKKPIHLTLTHQTKNGATPVPNDELDPNTDDTQHASHHPKLKAAPKKADTKGRRVIMSLEEALMASMSNNASHIRRIKKSKAMKGHFEDEDEDEEDESDSEEEESEEESGVSDEDDNDDDDEEEEEEEASPDSKSKRKRSRSVSAPVKRARLSGFRKDRHTSSNSATNKPKVIEVIDLTMDDSSDEEGPNSRDGGQAVTAKEASAPAPVPDTTPSNGNAGPEARAVADADLDVGREEQTEPEVKKMVFKPNHVPRRRARSPLVFTDPWKSVSVSLEETERGDQEGGVDPCVVLGDRSEVGSSGGVDRDVQQGGGEEEQARQQADGGVDDGVNGTLGIEDDDELMYPPTPEVPIAVIPTLGVEVDSTHVGVDALSGSAAAITPQEGDDFPLSSMHGIAPTTDENATNTTAQEVVDGLSAALEPLSVPVLSQPQDMVLELPDNNAGGVVDGGRYLLNGSDNTKEASVSASPTIHMKIDEDEVVGGAMDLAVSGQGAGDPDEIEEVTQRFLERCV
ncbi:hypothetical protein BJ165DRAFT_425491 [Panaeolus papilionaceus]|nr:hypothetical protein BJ165DRAFT_425491 [Panaeolus papilionaceus]